MQTATIIGSTGLIGSHILDLLKQDDTFGKIKVIVRKSFVAHHPRIEVIKIDFEDAAAFRSAIDGSTAVFVAVGTTQQKVKGNKAAYRKVDYDIPVNAAKLCAETGCKQFLLVSSIGANSSSANFYIQLKGEVEDEVKKQPIPAIHIFRPSMLLGHRENEFRLGEQIFQPIMKFFNGIIPAKWKAIAAEDVAKAMIAASRTNRTGIHEYEYKEIRQLA